jgi:hypothetical protein
VRGRIRGVSSCLLLRPRGLVATAARITGADRNASDAMRVPLRHVIVPNRAPASHVIAQLEQTVANNLRAYRQKWWDYQSANPANQANGACCLNNQTVQGQVAQSAVFDRGTGQTTVALANGATYIWP